MKDWADDNIDFKENGRNLSKRVKNTVGEKEKLLVTSNFSFSHSVFKRLVLQTGKNHGLFGKKSSGIFMMRYIPSKSSNLLTDDMVFKTHYHTIAAAFWHTKDM